MMTKLKIAVAALAMTTTAARSQTTVDQWVALCSKRTSESEQVACRSYVRGVADAIMLMQKLHPELTNICIPAGITDKELVDLTLPYVQGQPPTSPPLPAANLLTKALGTGFRCAR
jgi:hypothetical protein